MKAVIYARYSSSSQREESIEVQIRECTKYAEQHGYTVLKCYIDKAISGTTDKRPDFQQMIQDSKTHLFDTVLVLRTDRFSRDVADSAANKQILKGNGVRVISVTENFGEDAVGQLMGRFMESMAEYYSNELREKVQRGQNINAEKGIWNGGSVPFGLRVSKEQRLEADPDTAPFVVEAFKLYDGGATMTEIRDYLNAKGIVNSRGLPINYGNVQRLLSNRRYIGEYAYREYVLPDAIPPIVPLDMFERVQERMAKNHKAPARAKAEEEYLLTTKIYCGNCGAYMCGESGKGRNGTVHRYYKCVTVKKRRGDCKKKAVRKEWIEDLVVKETMRFLMDDAAIESIVSMLMWIQDQENVMLPLLEQRLKKAETGIHNLLAAIEQGLFTPSTKERLEALEAEKEEVQLLIEKEKLGKPKISAEFMTFWLQRFRKLDVTQKSHRQMLIDTFVNAVYVYDDRLLLTYNFKEGTDTISLADVKNATKEKNGSDLKSLAAPIT
ncbi:MAG: recombinase family protein [Faecousia sp.]